jgi:hypothetical protein
MTHATSLLSDSHILPAAFNRQVTRDAELEALEGEIGENESAVPVHKFTYGGPCAYAMPALSTTNRGRAMVTIEILLKF